MAGLLNQQQAQAGGMPQGNPGAPAPGGGPMAGQPDPGGESENVSPEEQAEYNEFVSNGMELIYDEQAMPQILQNIEGDGNPIEGLANSLVMIVMRLDESAQEGGKEISGDVKFHGATELMEQMVELAEQAGIHEYSEEDMESSLLLAMDLYRDMSRERGTLPVEELSEDMNEIVQADEQGRLDEMVPGLGQYAKRAPQPDEAQQAPGGGQDMGRRR